MTDIQDNKGFNIYAELTDRYGSTIRIKESSLATEPCVWIFCDNAKLDDPSPHLTPQQAKEVIRALQRFIDEVPERWENGEQYLAAPLNPTDITKGA